MNDTQTPAPAAPRPAAGAGLTSPEVQVAGDTHGPAARGEGEAPTAAGSLRDRVAAALCAHAFRTSLVPINWAAAHVTLRRPYLEQADAVMAIVDEATSAARADVIEEMYDGNATTEWAAFCGGDEAGEAALTRVTDDEGLAYDDAQWLIGGGVAKRIVLRSPWETVAEPGSLA